MAGKVNTKFVVLLSVGLVAVFGLLAWGFVTLAFKSGGDYERLGDQAMQQGDYYRAHRMYGRAVAHDTTNRVWLDKWVQAMEAWTPGTETAYRDAYQKNYLGALNQLAMAQRTDVAAHERLIRQFYVPLTRQYSRPSADAVADMARNAASYFTGSPDGEWRRLLRYRGLAMEAVLSANGVLDDEQIAQIAEDLRAALEADPGDGASMAALMRWTVVTQTRAARTDAARVSAEARREALGMGEAYLAEHPNDPDVELAILSFKGDLEYTKALQIPDESARMPSILAALEAFHPELDRVARLLREAEPGRVDVTHLVRFQRLEMFMDGAARLRRSLALTEEFLSRRPEDAELLMVSARMAQLAGELDRSSELLEKVSALPSLPVSMEGLFRHNLKRSAVLTRAGVMLDLHQRAMAEAAQGGDNTADAASLLETAKRLRNEFATQVSEDSTDLTMLDGRIAVAENRFPEALRLFQRYNGQTQNQDTEGLFYEARVGLELDQIGTTRTALDRLLEAEPNNMRALLMLGQVQLRLQEFRKAEELFKRVLDADPNNGVALAGLERIQSIRDPRSIEDPVVALLTEARGLRFGREDRAGDPAAAARLIESKLSQLNFDPRVAAELAGMRVDMGDIAGGRSIVAEAMRRHPQDPQLARLSEALSEPDPNRAVIRMIELSDQSEVDKLLAIAGVAMGRGMQIELDAALERLAGMAPDHPSYIEFAFVRATQRNDEARAEALAAKAEEANLDRVRGLSYRARIAAMKGDHARAVEALRQATALGTADAGVFRLLAIELRQIGRVDEAVQAFERSLQIRPDDVQSIYEYVLTLAQANRLESALETARRHQRFGLASPRFTELWLNLEAAAGGAEGLARAVSQRERLLEINPGDRANRAALARMYMDQKRWPAAKTLIDQLRAEGDAIELVDLAARWSADQGRVGARDGLTLAQEEFQRYIDGLSEPAAKTRGYLNMARFMLGRGRGDLALAAADRAVELEETATMLATKFKGEVLMSLNQNGPALEAFQKVVEAGADTEDAQYRQRLIETLIRVGRHQEAAGHLEKLPASARGTLTNLFQRAEVAAGTGDRAAERRILDEAVSRFPQDPLVFIKRAQSMANEPGMRGDALADLQAALALNPTDWRALRVRAAMRFEDGRTDEALTDLRQAVRANPSMDDAVFGVINEYLNAGQAGEAASVAREVVGRRTQDAPLMFELGRLFESRDMWDRASEFYGMAWNTRRGPTDGAKYIDALLRRSPPDAATANDVINALVQMAGGNIDANPGLLAAQALVLRARGREDFAQQQMTKAFEASLKDDAALMGWASNLARFYHGMAPDAELGYLRSLRTRYTEARAQAWLDLLLAFRRLDHGIDTEQAIDGLRRIGASESAPGSVRRFAMRQLGNHLYNADRFEEAVAAWRGVLALSPDEWDLNNNIAYVLSAKLNRPEEALPLAEKALSSDPDRSEPYDTLAGIYIRLGKYSEAEQMLDMAEPRSRTYAARVAVALTRARLELAQGRRTEAAHQVSNARAVLRSVAGRDAAMEAEIQAVESQIGSEG